MIKPDAASDNPSALSIRRIGQLSDFSKRVTCRLARSYAERDAIFKLRYQACLRAGSISQNSFGRHIEPADHAANAYLMGLYVDRRLVSSLRLQVGSATTPNFSTLELFPHAFEPILRDNKTVVDMGGVAGDGQLARSYVWLPYIVLRPWILAAEHFHADCIAAAVRPQHQIFYKRALDCELYPELRLPPHHLISAGLVTLDFATSAKRLYKTLSFLRSTPCERQQLFDPDPTPLRTTGQYPSVS